MKTQHCSSFPQNRKPVLQGFHLLRALAMLLVFYCHIPSIPAFRTFVLLPFGTSQAGAIAVSLFFVISGFAMAYNHSDESWRGMRDWCRVFWDRLGKFYPTALLVVFLSLPLAFVGGFRERLSSVSVLANLFLLQAWHLCWNLSGVVWFLSVLLFCYAVFPLFVQPFRRLGFYGRLLGPLFFWIVGIVGSLFVPDSDSFFKAFPPFRLYEFVAGMALGMEAVDIRKSQAGIRSIPLLAGLFWFVCIAFLQKRVPGFSSIAFYTVWTPGSLALVQGLSCAKVKLPSGALGRSIVFLSGISFPFYMFHQVSLRYAHVLLHILGWEHHFVPGLTAVGSVFFLMLVWCPIWNKRFLPRLTSFFHSNNPFSRT